MDLEFERGSRDHPCGHALVYFRDTGATDEIGVTYVVILPVPLDLSKYMPPFLATQVAEMASDTISSFAFPPAPEPVDGYEELMRIANLRGDDVLYGGVQSFADAFGMMEKVSEATAAYSEIYAEAHHEAGEVTAIEDGDDDFSEESTDDYDEDLAVDDLIYGSMAEADLLSELTSLLGRMRYAVDGGDSTTADESRAKIRAIGRYLPANRDVTNLIQAASQTTERSSQLAQLYLDRAYCLYREDYLRLKKIDEDIAALKGTD